MRIILAAMSLALLVAPLAASPAATPLCRDSKGLFTPCIGVRMPAARITRRPAVDGAASDDRAGTQRNSSGVGRHEPARRALVERGKLCRDSKGLFKPC